jgi:hypothetical protein
VLVWLVWLAWDGADGGREDGEEVAGGEEPAQDVELQECDEVVGRVGEDDSWGVWSGTMLEWRRRGD